MLMPLNWMCIFENRFRITATYTAIISNLYLGTMVFYFSLAIVFLYLTIPIITLRTRWLLRLTTECYKWIVVFEMVTFIVKISICMANWYSRYLRLFGEREKEREYVKCVCVFSLFVNHHPLVSCSTLEKNQIMAIHPRAFAVNISKFNSKLMWLSCDLSFYTIFLGKVLRLLLWRMIMRALEIVQKQSKQQKIR